MKVILKHAKRSDFLLPTQFGVGTKGGVEPIVRAVENAMDFDHGYEHYNYLTSLDFKNAFNTLERADVSKGLKRYAPISKFDRR